MGRVRKPFGTSGIWLPLAIMLSSIGAGAALILAGPLRPMLGENGYIVRVALPPHSSTRLVPSAAPSSTTRQIPLAARQTAGLATGLQRREPDVAIAFELSETSAAARVLGAPVEIRKRVRVNGVEAGSAIVYVNMASELSLGLGDLRGILGQARYGDIAEQLGDLSNGGELIGFEQLRKQGVEIRYDASDDRVDLSL